MPMKPIPRVNMVTTATRSQPAYDANTTKTPGPIAAIDVKSLREFVIPKYLRLMRKSDRTPVIRATIHKTTYGREVYRPFFLIENRKTSFCKRKESITVYAFVRLQKRSLSSFTFYS